MNKLTTMTMGTKRDEVIAFGVKAKADSAAVLASASGIAVDAAYSPSGRSEQLGKIVAAGRAAFSAQLAAVTTLIEGVKTAAAEDLAAATSVPDSDMATRAAILAPVLMNAVSNPSGLIRSYRRNFTSPIDRRLIEETASALLDALAEPERGRFQFALDQAKRELFASIPDVEREALLHVSDAEELAHYAGHVCRVVNARFDQADALDTLRSDAVGIAHRVRAGLMSTANSEHFAATFERTGSLLGNQGGVRGFAEFVAN